MTEQTYRTYICLAESSLCDWKQDCVDVTIERNHSCCADATQELHCVGEPKCIPNGDVCNGITDCYDLGNDECGCSGSSHSRVCELTGRCVHNTSYCDGINDCGHDRDWTDECYCYDTRFCKNTGICLPRWQLCDGVDDCGDGSDEDDCADIASDPCLLSPYGDLQCATFTSAADKCVPRDSLCDGVSNCIDGSDENGCQDMCKEDESRCALKFSFDRSLVHGSFTVVLL